MLADLAGIGWVGVDVFFVISGFAMSWILLRAQEPANTTSSARFLARRLLRLMPPYLACCVMVVALQFASSLAPGFHGQAFALPSVAQVACHVVYACDAFSIPWFNPVFWTLAIEVQFYVAIAAIALVATRARAAWIYTLVGFIVVASVSAEGGSLLRYAPHFAIGALLARHFQTGTHRAAHSAAVLACLVVIGMGLGIIEAMAAAVAATVCLLPWRPPRWALWLGTVSYSVYLVHVPVGGRIANLLERLHPTPWGWTGVAVVATVVTLASSWLMFRIAERPAIDLSRRAFSNQTTSAARLDTAKAST